MDTEVNKKEILDENKEANNDEAVEDKEESEEIKDNAEEDDFEANPDSYLNRNNEYSSERFKIEIKNLPKNFGFAQLRKFLRSLNLKFVKVNSPGRCTYAFVTFVDDNAKQEAMKALNGYKYKGKDLTVVNAKPAADPTAAIKNNDSIRNNKRKNQNDSNDADTKVQKVEDDTPLEEKVQNSTTPLWKLTYEEQLVKKREEVRQVLIKFGKKIEQTNREVNNEWLKKQRIENESMCCKLEGYLPSPVIDNYRNKCEFSIGYNVDETKQVIGFRLGEYKSGSNEVVSPQSCKNVPDEVKNLVQIFQEYLTEKSKYKSFSVRTHEGNWRQLTVRNNQSKEMLAIIVFDKKELTDDEINEEKQNLKNFIESKESENFKLVSLLFFLNTRTPGIGDMNNKLEKLIGNDDCLYEQLFDLKFRISPLAFFQANTKGAELLYQKIGEFSDIDENTVVLDVCCGTGTIGITLAKRAKLVVGVDIIPQAIEDAKLNSKLNNLTNTEYICGKAEDVLVPVLRRFENSKVIAIVDPPRAGLHSKVIQALRRLRNLDTIVYVSCNAELAMPNFIDFARPESKTYQNDPFIPVKALGVDMFPHTSHFELVVLLKRFNDKLTN